LTGFQTVRREGVRLTVGFTARVDTQLTLGGLEETITVSGASPPVDTTSTATSTELTREQLEVPPTSRDGFHSFEPRLRADIYNALNKGTVRDRTLLSGANYLRPTLILFPRIVQLGATLTFQAADERPARSRTARETSRSTGVPAIRRSPCPEPPDYSVL
jgi:hypothetical protein